MTDNKSTDVPATQQAIDTWLSEHCGRGLPYENAHNLETALHGAAYTLGQIRGTDKYSVNIGQTGPASSGILWLLEYVARNEIALASAAALVPDANTSEARQASVPFVNDGILEPAIADAALQAYDLALTEDANDRIGALNMAVMAALSIASDASEAKKLREAVADAALWMREAASRSQSMIDLNLDRAAKSVENMQLREALESIVRSLPNEPETNHASLAQFWRDIAIGYREVAKTTLFTVGRN